MYWSSRSVFKEQSYALLLKRGMNSTMQRFKLSIGNFIFFCVALLFQLLTLPIEFNASMTVVPMTKFTKGLCHSADLGRNMSS